jgi:hypothetical protein
MVFSTRMVRVQVGTSALWLILASPEARHASDLRGYQSIAEFSEARELSWTVGATGTSLRTIGKMPEKPSVSALGTMRQVLREHIAV